MASIIMVVKVPFWLKNVLSVRFRTVGLQTPFTNGHGITLRWVSDVSFTHHAVGHLRAGERNSAQNWQKLVAASAFLQSGCDFR